MIVMIPDGITLPLGNWDDTVSDTFAKCFISQTSAAAKIAENKKINRFPTLINHFVAFAIENLGVEALKLINKIGSYLVNTSGDVRPKAISINV